MSWLDVRTIDTQQQYSVVPFRIVPLGRDWGRGCGQAGPCMGWCMVGGGGGGGDDVVGEVKMQC